MPQAPTKESIKDSEEDKESLLDSSFRIVEDAMDRLELPNAAREFLRSPQREMRFQIPVKMTDGSVTIFDGFRVKWNMSRGPAKGGLRFHPDETIDTIRMLAAGMTWKTAVLDLPLGGGKGGVVCNPKKMSERELERLSRGYIRTIAHQVGPNSDVPAPDVYTDSQIMAWMEDEFEYISGERLSGVVTGKPVNLGGSLGRDGATALGGLYTIREALEEFEIEREDATVAIQGYGKAGASAHKYAEDFGMKVVAVSDSQGAIYNDNGLPFEEVFEAKENTESVVNYPTAETMSNENLLELDVDVLVPAALENVITEKNAENVRASVVAELANNSSTYEANQIMDNNGVYVIPDILCNAGGVTVSYFEQVQNASNYYWDLETVHGRLEDNITDAFHDVHELAIDRGITTRLAAFILAVDRVHTAMETRGWV